MLANCIRPGRWLIVSLVAWCTMSASEHLSEVVNEGLIGAGWLLGIGKQIRERLFAQLVGMTLRPGSATPEPG